jgi:hypothetical protein
MNKTIPQYLYHGTSAKAARIAMTEGIQPRGKHGKSNWKRTIESNPDTVYLTDAYPVYFALNAAGKGNQGAVLQIDVAKLCQPFLVPDEDVLEQAGRGRDDVPGSMKKRTRHYRAQMSDHIGLDTWLTSLEAMGTCGFMATIPPEAISRVAMIDFNKASHLSMFAGDAMICLGNYRFCGPKYRNLTNQLFGLATEDDPLHGQVPENLDGLPDDARAMVERMAEHRREAEAAMAADLATVEWVDLTQAEAA